VPVSLGSNAPSSIHVDPIGSPTGEVNLQRRWFVTDRNGVEHEITSPEVLDRIMADMTPEEVIQLKNSYRFAPIKNLTGNKNYMGTLRDLH
jgi:hypothetical protein